MNRLLIQVILLKNKRINSQGINSLISFRNLVLIVLFLLLRIKLKVVMLWLLITLGKRHLLRSILISTIKFYTCKLYLSKLKILGSGLACFLPTYKQKLALSKVFSLSYSKTIRLNRKINNKNLLKISSLTIDLIKEKETQLKILVIMQIMLMLLGNGFH